MTKKKVDYVADDNPRQIIIDSLKKDRTILEILMDEKMEPLIPKYDADRRADNILNRLAEKNYHIIKLITQTGYWIHGMYPEEVPFKKIMNLIEDLTFVDCSDKYKNLLLQIYAIATKEVNADESDYIKIKRDPKTGRFIRKEI